MNDLCYWQYAFVTPQCQTSGIGSGVDPSYDVELIVGDQIAALVSRIDLEHFSVDKLEGKTPEDIEWLGGIAKRHNEIISQTSQNLAVLPLRLGTIFRSLESVQCALERCRPSVLDFFSKIANCQEWGVKIYFDKSQAKTPQANHTASPPHFNSQSGTAYLTQKKLAMESHREQRAGIFQTTQTVETKLSRMAEDYCRVRILPGDLTGRGEEMVFNAAYLLPSSLQLDWLNEINNIDDNIRDRGLTLEVSGPWPPYHFCPKLDI